MFGLFAAIGACISSAVSFVSGCIGAISSVAGSVCSGLGSLITGGIGAIGSFVESCGPFLNGFLSAFGVGPLGDPVELGRRMEVERPRQGEKLEDYLIRVKKLELEHKELTMEEKAKFGLAGIDAQCCLLKEKIGVQVTPKFLHAMSKAGMMEPSKSNFTKNCIESMKEKGFKSTDPFAHFLGDRENLTIEEKKEIMEVEAIVEDVVKKENPGASDFEVAQVIDEMKEKAQAE